MVTKIQKKIKIVILPVKKLEIMQISNNLYDDIDIHEPGKNCILENIN